MGTINKIATTYLATCHAQMLSKTSKQRNNFKTKFQQSPIKLIHKYKIWQNFTNLETQETNQIHKCTKQKKERRSTRIEHCWIAAPHKTRNKNHNLPSSFVQLDSSQTLA
jgi:hypothetical protein